MTSHSRNQQRSGLIGALSSSLQYSRRSGRGPPSTASKFSKITLLACSIAFIFTLLLQCTVGLENGLGRTPPMGWLAWERFRCNTDCFNDPHNCISERLFRQVFFIKYLLFGSRKYIKLAINSLDLEFLMINFICRWRTSW